MIIQIPKTTKKKAEEFLGKQVTWTSPAKKKITGYIKRLHGNKGALRVHFKTGMPGQAIGTKVTISTTP